jgi:hypothetical protein
MKYVIELSDIEGLSCRISLSLPIRKVATDRDNSTWKVLDEGFLKYRSGGCEIRSSVPGRTYPVTGNLRLCVGNYHGVILNNFTSEWALVNDSGSGYIYQPWVKNCKPGEIGWVLLE